MKTSGYLGVRNGLILDPKHREKIGPALFLFLYLMANADYETGTLDRKIDTICDDMGKVPKRTVEHWIGILKKGKYIKTNRLYRAFHIEILKWWHPNHQTKSSKSCGADDQSTATFSLVNRNILKSNPQNLVEPTKSYGLINNQKQKEKSDITAKSCGAIKNFYQESLTKKGGGTSPAINFLNFAGWAHKRFRRFPLVFNDQDRGRVQNIIDLGIEEKNLKRAWLFFLNDRDQWLEGKPRSIAIFKSQVNDYLARIPNPTPAPCLVEPLPAALEKIQAEPGAENLWSQVLHEVEHEILPENFNTWFVSTVGLMISRDRVVVGVPNRFYQKCLQENYVPLIQKSIASAAGFDPGPNIKFEIQDA